MNGRLKLVVTLLLFALSAVAVPAAAAAILRAPGAAVLRAPVPAPRLVFTPAAPFQSSWAARPPTLNGVVATDEWSAAARMPLSHGALYLQNDLRNLYLLIDVTADTTNDPMLPSSPWGDYFWLVWDTNGDRNVTPDVDLLHGTYPGTNTLGLSRFVEPGAVSLLQPSTATLARGFGPTPDSPAPHRFWEVCVPLAEIGAEAARWARNPLDAHPLSLGLHLSSQLPAISDYIPQDLLSDFTRFIRVLLALGPDPTGLGGPIFATVGVIPSTQIVDGCATTDPSYCLYVENAPFGATLNIFGHFDGLRARHAQYYRVQARKVGTPDWTPLRLTWSNYRWEGDRFVLRPCAPDPEDRYQLTQPGEIWSLRDILVGWPTWNLSDGLWELKLELFDSNKQALVPQPTEAEGNHLILMLDNTPPRVEIEQVTYADTVIGRCVIVDLGPPPDGLRFQITVQDYQGHLSDYRLVAHYGDNESQLITGDDYSSHMTPTSKLWNGVAGLIFPTPPAQWRPPEPCAYQFRLSAHDRATNGYSPRLHYNEYNKHVTILMGGPPIIVRPAVPPPPEVGPPGLSPEITPPPVPGPPISRPRMQ